MKISFSNVQCSCDGFQGILPHSERGQREYGRADARRVPASDYTTFGHLVFGGHDVDYASVVSPIFFLLAYHRRSVIARVSPMKGQQRSESSACKLSERVSSVRSKICRCSFSSLLGFLLFRFMEFSGVDSFAPQVRGSISRMLNHCAQCGLFTSENLPKGDKHTRE